MESLSQLPANAAAPLVDVVESASDAARLRQPPLLIRGSLEDYLDGLGLGRGPLRAQRIGEGHSNATFVIERDGFEAVLRRPPRPPYPKHAHNVLREARVQEALADTAVPVPQILVTCRSDEVLGAPFYLMERLHGQVVTARLPAELDDAGARRRMIDSLVDSLAALHAVDPAAVGLQDWNRGPDFLERQLNLFDKLWLVNKVREIPELSGVREWLREHQPADAASTLVHGDFRLGNVMYEPSSSGTIDAVLDWELITVGDPMTDLGYLLSTFTEPGDPESPLLGLGGVLRGGGFPGREYVAARYAEKSGRSLENLRWHVAFAFWRTAVGLEGYYKRAVAGLTDDPFNHALKTGIPQLASCAAATAFDGEFV
ncbi:phosphotransferase family protein [Prauserella cavernicola]|uniref:Phosphotransferase family protein n=1 Tax=Prauserella cavernicola TaxID=2800127 RepID=A0A934QVT7_9PSEU|nr:phosphotransferase family protein [Prauserella cavernicola]MBK1787291.1 phosphotransferase family protein [Prauserella cavernicola]